jgi:hypothetical protein
MDSSKIGHKQKGTAGLSWLEIWWPQLAMPSIKPLTLLIVLLTSFRTSWTIKNQVHQATLIMGQLRPKITSSRQRGRQFIKKISIIRRGKVLIEMGRNNSNTKVLLSNLAAILKKRTVTTVLKIQTFLHKKSQLFMPMRWTRNKSLTRGGFMEPAIQFKNDFNLIIFFDS